MARSKAKSLVTSPPEYSANPEFIFVEIIFIGKGKLFLRNLLSATQDGTFNELNKGLLHLMQG